MPDLSSFAPKDFITAGLLILSVLGLVLFFHEDDQLAVLGLGAMQFFAILALMVNLKM